MNEQTDAEVAVIRVSEALSKLNNLPLRFERTFAARTAINALDELLNIILAEVDAK